MKHQISVCVGSALVGLLAALPATAAPVIFFGENLSPGGAVIGDPVTARDSFLAGLSGVGTEDFESFTNGNVAPVNLSFPGSGGTIDATLTGAGQIRASSFSGRFATSGTDYWDVSGAFNIDFSTPIAAFGFFGTDGGDGGGQLTVTLTPTVGDAIELVVPNTTTGGNAALLFWGFIDPNNSYTSISFGNTVPNFDFFGLDDVTVADLQQVTLPEPASLAVFGLGLATLGFLRRRRHA